ncbi:hypothetical protein QOZ95_004996 [Paenibacillus brasilensis]|uniref:Uncharacterized protein n=1 Tax=Paenibacillus brasilensis TaxID=128574 RepID=A0ABU0L6B6_9BACL|nr:hypothetical protein [Paenibacillus brasilensis]
MRLTADNIIFKRRLLMETRSADVFTKGDFSRQSLAGFMNTETLSETIANL